ncbi:methylenetetrahydrofolate reductase, partial [Acinetobacter guillouiae]|nr:methylenetetrahydrofolate reductase [Acinetobacter guillouiae]
FLVWFEFCGQCRLAESFFFLSDCFHYGLGFVASGVSILELCDFGDGVCILSVKARLGEEVDHILVLK